MQWFRVIVGFVFANAIFGYLLYLVIESLWHRYFVRRPKESDKKTHRQPLLTFLVGYVERLMYALAICIGAWQWIGFWIGVKVAIRWRNKDSQPDGSSDNIWLLGTSLSLLCSYVCAGLALGHLIIKYPNH